MEKTGTILGIPYDFSRPTLARLKERFWNPDDPRIFTPHFFGIGWSLNFATLRKRSTFWFVVATVLTGIACVNIVRSSMRSLADLRKRLRA